MAAAPGSGGGCNSGEEFSGGARRISVDSERK